MASIHSETTLFYEIRDKEAILDYFSQSDLFMFDEWENGNGKLNLCGKWYKYNDSLIDGSMILGEILANLSVDGSSLKVVTTGKQTVEKCEQLLESLKGAVRFIKRDVKTTKLPFHGKFMNYVLLCERENQHHFAVIAQEAILIGDIEKPIPLLSNMSMSQHVEAGQSELAEGYLREYEYRSFMLNKREQQKQIVTPDYNNVRRKLNLPLSPFVTSYQDRVTSIEKVENPTEKPSRLK